MNYKKQIINSINGIIEATEDDTDLYKGYGKQYESKERPEETVGEYERVIIYFVTLQHERAALKLSIKHLDKFEGDDVLINGRNKITKAFGVADRLRNSSTLEYMMRKKEDEGYAERLQNYAKYTGMTNGFAMSIACFHISPIVTQIDDDLPF